MLVVGMREMFSEMLDEMRENKSHTRKARKEAKQLNERATKLRKKLIHWKGACNSLKDDIQDEQELATEMSDKAEEYEWIIDVMEADFEKQLVDQEAHYKSVIDYMDQYYEEVVENMSPRFIRKHWVKNEGRGKLPWFIIIIQSCSNLSAFAILLQIQVHMRSGCLTWIN